VREAEVEKNNLGLGETLRGGRRDRPCKAPLIVSVKGSPNSSWADVEALGLKQCINLG